VQLANERITFRDLDIIQHFLADNGPDAQMSGYGDETRLSNSTGWRFGTFLFSISGLILPIDKLIFFKMVKTTNQSSILKFRKFSWLFLRLL